MKEKNQSGDWPANSISDLTSMRDELRDDGYTDADFVFVAHYKITRYLDAVPSDFSHTYKNWMMHEDILHSIITDNSLNENEGYLYATNKGMPFIKHIEGLLVIPHDSVYKYNFIQNVIVESEKR